MPSRYNNRRTGVNGTSQYRSIFERRGVSQIRQFLTGRFTYPTQNQISNLQLKTHLWKTGDHFYKLADKFYGDSTYWWVIALFNKQPTEANIQYGDVIHVPMPLARTLEYFNV